MTAKVIAVTGVRNRRGELLRDYAWEIAAHLRIGVMEFLHDADEAGRLAAEQRLAFRVADEAVHGLPTILPQEESRLSRRWMKHDIFIPIGSDESGPFAVGKSLLLAEALGSRVVMFHSTWRKPHLETENALEHCRARTRKNLEAAEEQAKQAGVPSTVLAGIHSDIVEGIILTALRERCCLIATARGLNIGRGSHVDRLIVQSPLPILVWR